MTILRLVVNRRTALDDLRQRFSVKSFTLARCAPDFLSECQHRASIAIRHTDEGGTRVHRQRQRLLFCLLGSL